MMKFCLESKINHSNGVEVFSTLYSLTEELIAIQRKHCILNRLKNQSCDRVALANELLSSRRRCLKHNISVGLFDSLELGLFSEAAINEGECILRIPRSDILVATSQCGNFNDFVRTDPIASAMENVRLSLRLLLDLSDWTESPFYPFIRTLPVSYRTCLYMTPDDVVYLRGSKALEMTALNFQSICRQYAYFFNRFQNSDMPFASAFCFEDYRWAVSTIMTRNNSLPKGMSDVKEMCLVPLWEIINHKFGKVTTYFDAESEELVFCAMETVVSGEQIFMDYGKRTSAEFLLFSGFVPVENPHNHIPITLGVSLSDPLYVERIRLLQLVGLECPLERNIDGDLSSLYDLITFARVFVMDEEQLRHYVHTEESALSTLRMRSFDSNSPLDTKSSDFLAKRFQLLIMAYGSILTESDPAYSKLSAVQRNCERLRAQEVNLLRASLQAIRGDEPPFTSPSHDRLISTPAP